VYVDAKILNMHDRSLPHEAFVGYFVEGEGRTGARQVAASVNYEDELESDDAEVLAILFAIEELGEDARPLQVVCDHASVVSEATRKEAKRPSPLMERLRAVLNEKPWIRLKALPANPAHGVVTEYVNLTRTKAN
jgi:hypothetical protein